MNILYNVFKSYLPPLPSPPRYILLHLYNFGFSLSFFKKKTKTTWIPICINSATPGCEPCPVIYQRSQLPNPHTVWDPKLRLGTMRERRNCRPMGREELNRLGILMRKLPSSRVWSVPCVQRAGRQAHYTDKQGARGYGIQLDQEGRVG